MSEWERDPITGEEKCISGYSNVVRQYPTSTDADYRVLFSNGANDNDEINLTRKDTDFKYNPSTNNLMVGSVNDVKLAKSGDNFGYYDANGNFKTFRQPTGNAGVAQVLADDGNGNAYTFSNASSDGLTGAMVNQGAKNQALNCGGSYTIPQGYHNGSGKVTANSLASQTGVDSGKTAAGAGQILTGYQAWVNGNKVTGTMANYSTNSQKVVTWGATDSSRPAMRDLTLNNVAYYEIAMPTGYWAWSWGNSSALVPKETKTITASRSAQTVTPTNGKVLSSVTVNKYPDASGNYTCGSNNGAPASNDMGATNNYRYVDARSVYKKGVADGKAAVTGTSKAIDLQGKTSGQNSYTRSYSVAIGTYLVVLFAGGAGAGSSTKTVSKVSGTMTITQVATKSDTYSAIITYRVVVTAAGEIKITLKTGQSTSTASGVGFHLIQLT